MTTVLFAIQNTDERKLFEEVLETQGLEMRIVVPDSVQDADRLVSSHEADVIVTDFEFQNGGFADWLFLWQHPFVIIADWSEYDRLTTITADQTSDFVIRDPDCRHIRYLPLVIRKVLNNQESMERHNIDLRMTEQRYRELVQALPDIVYSLDEDGCITFVNDSVKYLGWDPVELIGKHFSVLLDDAEVQRVSRTYVLPELAGTATGDTNAPKLFDERRTGERRTRGLEIRLKHKDAAISSVQARFGTVIAYGEVNAVGFRRDPDVVQSSGTVGIIRDITERVETNQLLRQGLQEKEILLSEVHHRVKNNMQVISSLLNLQAEAIEDAEALRRFTDAQMQIQSMALIHEHLYRSDRFDQVEIEEYVRRLVAHLVEVYRVDEHRITITCDLAPLSVTIRQAVPVALLLNELLSNSFKYAFPGEARGTIAISVRRDDTDTMHLSVSDDGVGLPPHFDIAASGSLGHTLISALTDQLTGALEVDGTDGTTFTIQFPIEQFPLEKS